MQYCKDLFDSFCDPAPQPTEEQRANKEIPQPSLQLDRLEEHMRRAYTWTPLPEPIVVIPAAPAAAAGAAVGLEVEPIIHSKFTKAQRERALEEVRAARAKEESTLLQNEATVLAEAGGAVDRGTRHMSNKAVSMMKKYQQQLNATVNGRKTNAKPGGKHDYSR